jgi:hypothetical protein
MCVSEWDSTGARVNSQRFTQTVLFFASLRCLLNRSPGQLSMARAFKVVAKSGAQTPFSKLLIPKPQSNKMYFQCKVGLCNVIAYMIPGLAHY